MNDNREALAREVLEEHGIEVMGGSMAWRANVETGYAIIAAMLAFADRHPVTLETLSAYESGVEDGKQEGAGEVERLDCCPCCGGWEVHSEGCYNGPCSECGRRGAEYTPAPHIDPAERAMIEAAIKKTEYKYFGDYEFSDDQRAAVDQLVTTAQNYLNGERLTSSPSPAGGEWRDIATAPRDGTWFWAYWPVAAEHDQQRVTQWLDDAEESRWVDSADFCDWISPTHWMPLPTPPQPKDAK